MGATFGDTCYATATEAAGAYCGVQFPRTSSAADGSPIVQSCAPGAGVVTITSVASAASSASTLALAFPPCTVGEQYAELGVLWSLGAGLIALVHLTRGTFGFLWKDF